MKSQIYKLPQEFLTRLKKVYPSYYASICESFLHKKEQSFRINYLKTDLQVLRHELKNERIIVSELNCPPGSFVLKSDLRRFQNTRLYREGLVYVQNISSMIPPLVLNPQKGEKILDLCAAPGTKTTQIASLVQGEAEIVAIEKIRVRYYKLLANLRVQGADSVKAVLMDGIMVRKKYNEYFDRILLDAPCSAEGRFLVTNPRTYRYWKLRKVKEMVHKQRRLFTAAFYALRPGGEMVYSTCTFSPEENEGVVSWALDKFSEKIELMPVDVPIKEVVPGLVSWQGKKFSETVKLTRRVIPDSLKEGFFIARFRKKD